MKVGFIGLGTMGSGMALNALKGGHELVVHDINREAAAPHLEAGATWVDTPRAVVEASEVVFTSLPGPPEVQAVALGENGLLHGIRPGKVYFDLSTDSPTLVRRIHDVFAKMGAHVLDAPVSGGPQGARNVQADAFFKDLFETALTSRDVLTAIRIPAADADSRTSLS